MPVMYRHWLVYIPDHQQIHKLSGLTKPGEGGEILALFQLMLLFLDSKVPLFLFASHSFLANYLHFMVKLIDKAIVINVKIHKNERKRLYSSNKDNWTCWDKRITAHFEICTDEIPGENQITNPKINKQTLPVPNVLLDCVIFFLLF